MQGNLNQEEQVDPSKYHTAFPEKIVTGFLVITFITVSMKSKCLKQRKGENDGARLAVGVAILEVGGKRLAGGVAIVAVGGARLAVGRAILAVGVDKLAGISTKLQHTQEKNL